MSPRVQVDFPGVGTLFTNKAGRIDFTFQKDLLHHFEQESTRVSTLAMVLCSAVLAGGLS